MPDEVETYAGPRPWWENTSKTVKAATIVGDGHKFKKEEIIEAAGLDWTIDTVPVFLATPDGPVEIAGYKAIIREKDNEVYGIASDSYKKLQHRILFDVSEDVIDESDVAHFETAGALFNGKIVWSLLALGDKDGIRIDGDPSPYNLRLLAWTGHDGRHALRFSTVFERVLCANTLTYAQAGAKDSIALRHTSNAEYRIGDIRRALKIAFNYKDTFEKVAKDLQLVHIGDVELDAFTEKLLPVPDDGKEHTRITNQRDAIKALYRSSDSLDGVGQNGYRLLQAVAEFTDHTKSYGQRAGAEDRRALAILEGSAYGLKTKAVRLLLPTAASKN